MLTQLLVDLCNGEMTAQDKLLYINCKNAKSVGVMDRTVINREGVLETVSAFFFVYGNVEYGRTGIAEKDFSAYCNHCCGVNAGEGGAGEFNNDFGDDFNI